MLNPHPTPRSSLPWWGRWPALGGAVCVALVGAGLAQTHGLIGYDGGEIWGHAWVQWWHAAGLPGWPSGPEGLLVPSRPWPVIDPLVTGVAAVVGRLAGVVAGWNTVILGATALAFAGGWWLARAEGGVPLVGGVALALAPALLGAQASGLTEDLAVGLAAIGLGLVGRGGARAGLAAGLALGLLAGCGLVLAWGTALVAVGFGVHAVIRDRARLRGVLRSGGVAVAVALPMVWMQGERLWGAGHRMGAVPPRPEPLWGLNPWRGVDLASLITPGRVDPDGALIRMHPGYLGLSLLALAVIGGRSRWWPVLVGAVLASLGDTVSVAGEPTGLANPVAWALELLPFGDLINHHGRLLLLGSVALAVLAARGAARLGPRVGYAVALVALDLVAFNPVGIPLPVADPRPLAVYEASAWPALPEGPLVVLPSAGPGVHPQRPLFDQRVHGRALLLDPNRPGPPAAAGQAGRWMAQVGRETPSWPPEPWAWPDGIAVIVVQEPWVTAVEAGLGPPAVRTAEASAWAATSSPQ